MGTEKACRTCSLISTGQQICPRCKTHTLSDDFTSVVIILDPAKSEIAKRLNIKEAGKYALKVR
nr:transcription elongation factor subunit Spt4 [Candidatus Sigynarchaeum springense]